MWTTGYNPYMRLFLKLLPQGSIGSDCMQDTDTTGPKPVPA